MNGHPSPPVLQSRPEALDVRRRRLGRGVSELDGVREVEDELRREPRQRRQRDELCLGARVLRVVIRRGLDPSARDEGARGVQVRLDGRRRCGGAPRLVARRSGEPRVREREGLASGGGFGDQTTKLEGGQREGDPLLMRRDRARAEDAAFGWVIERRREVARGGREVCERRGRRDGRRVVAGVEVPDEGRVGVLDADDAAVEDRARVVGVQSRDERRWEQKVVRAAGDLEVGVHRRRAQVLEPERNGRERVERREPDEHGLDADPPVARLGWTQQRRGRR
mmetsp:Transcript_1649/g.6372  ORF Transcript_1649/g.6372 Transcript_1649/m.6372 type:complete len:281 (-) Transcript_1649:1006-1848(-)